MRIALITLVGIAVLALVASTQTPAPQGSQFADEEVPRGIVDGVNDTFTIARAPYPFLALKLYRNGIRLRRCREGIPGPCDYTLIAPYNRLVFTADALPLPGDLLIVDYRY